MFVIIGVVEFHPLAGEIQLDFMPKVCRHLAGVFHALNVRPRLLTPILRCDINDRRRYQTPARVAARRVWSPD